MNKSNEIVSSKTGTSKLSRAKFGPGMLLKHEDLELLNSYTRDLNRLMFRSLFGCGVVCGLVVDTKTECGKVVVTVGSGIAITCSGDPIWVPRDDSLPAYAGDECDNRTDKELWIVLCGTVKCCAPRPATCSSGDDELPSVCTRELFGYELRVMDSRPKCVCDCLAKPPSNGANTGQNGSKDVERETATCLCADPNLPCYVKHYAGDCGCSCGECSDCDCDCVLLARLERDPQVPDKWKSDHGVRRFVRPVLMRDPRVEKEKEALVSAAADNDPQIALELEKLSEQYSEKEMARVRETWKCFSGDEKAQVVKILGQYQERDKASELWKLLIKYRDAKLDPRVTQARNVTSLLAADLEEALRSNPPRPRSRKTK